MTTRTRERASAHDHLTALAAPFHPHVFPVFDWQRHLWRWVPPWMDAHTPVERGEELGRNYQQAARSLVRLHSRLPCAHGQPITRRCDKCRLHVLENMPKGTHP